MSEQPETPYVVVTYQGQKLKVRVPPPIPDAGIRVYKAILDNAEAMRLRDAGRE